MVRELANKALIEIENGKFSTQVLNRYSRNLDNRDKAFLRELVYGVLENKTYLDYIIDKASKIKTNKLQKDVLNVLRLSIYQLIFLDLDDYAIINEGVNVIKKTNKKSSGFVNGVLRNINRNLNEFKKIDIKDKKEYLSVRYSHPIKLIDYLLEYFSYEEVEKILKHNNETSYNDLRINQLNTTQNDLFKKLKDEGINVRKSEISKSSLKLNEFIDITNRKDFLDGDYTIQSEPSALTSEILNPKEGSKVLDLCAAPGSKTTHLASIMNNIGEVVANDISEEKLRLIRENQVRMGINILKYDNFDASILNEKYINSFDYILCDVPCSGLGLIGKKPDIRWNFDIDNLKSLNKIQKEILNNAYRYLKDKGKIVYSTCTYGKCENEDVVEQFLQNHEDMELGDFKMKTFTPEDGCDGFFIGELRKR